MQVVISSLLWGLFIAGGLPSSGQRLLENRLPWWHSRLMGIVSSLVEAVCGWQLLRDVLFRYVYGVMAASGAVPLGMIGGFLLLEGLLRLGITIKLDDSALPSLPVSAVWKTVTAVFNIDKESVE